MEPLEAVGPLSSVDVPAVPAPELPPGELIDLPGRGTGFVRRIPGPAGALETVLLHGWTVTADTTFLGAYPALAGRYGVIAADLRGHGAGIRAKGRTRLVDCADDVPALLDALGVEKAVVVGYSLGGAVAQLVWQRHRDRVAGLVLCSTAKHFQGGPISDLWYRGQGWVSPLVRAVPGPAQRYMARAVNGKISDGPYALWFRAELVKSDPSALLSIGADLGRFRSTGWIGGVDVPVGFVLTTADRTVPTYRQRALARTFPGAPVAEVDGPHNSVVTKVDQWVAAFRSVLDRVAAEVTDSTT